MNLLLDNGIMYANNRRICFGQTELPAGKYDLAVAFSHQHGKTLPEVVDKGWFGDIIIVGDVKAQALMPSIHTIDRIAQLITAEEDLGRRNLLEIV